MQEVLPELVSVSELNRLARGLLERGLPPLWVSGEISNLTVAASGHAYFSLKDKGGQIRAVMFRGRVAGLPFRLREGVQVEAFGQVSLYEARGDYQIQLDRMREAGLGRLFEAFERLKRQLGEEGLTKRQAGHPAAKHHRANLAAFVFQRKIRMPAGGHGEVGNLAADPQGRQAALQQAARQAVEFADRNQFG
jgi:hypothetical protein